MHEDLILLAILAGLWVPLFAIAIYADSRQGLIAEDERRGLANSARNYKPKD